MGRKVGVNDDFITSKNKKRRASGGEKCHTRTMMYSEVNVKTRFAQNKCCLFWRDKGRGNTCTYILSDIGDEDSEENKSCLL
jgi:hypothetical protein